MVTVGAPTLGEARRAAEALMTMGVGQVWLFGSLARGDQRAVSDIDLVAVFDDLDYRNRWRVESELTMVASSAAGRAVDVVVTDRPEWRFQQRRVSASFAAAIRGELTLLADRPATKVDWDKEQSMATSNEQLARQRIDDVTGQLTRIIGLRWPSRDEVVAAGDDPVRHERLMAARLIGLCEAAHMAVEGSLKAVGTLTGVAAKLLHAHDVGVIAEALPPETRDAMAALLASSPGLIKTTGYITMWRTKGAYQTPGEGMTAQDIATPAFTAAITAIAADVAAAAADWLTRHGIEPASVTTLKAHTREIHDHITHINLGSGEPHPTTTH